jgi:hypothetical protein
VALIAALRGGEERAFEILIKRYHVSLVRIALTCVPDTSAAEEEAPETWLTAVQWLTVLQPTVTVAGGGRFTHRVMWLLVAHPRYRTIPRLSRRHRTGPALRSVHVG